MMKKGIAKLTAFALTAGLTLGSVGITALAAGADTALVGLGTAAVSSKSASGESAQPAEEAAAEEAVHDISVEEGAEGLDTSMVGTTGFAQCDEYLNVRSDAGIDGEVVGKVYPNGSMEILGVASNGWYEIQSGNVTGYVSPEFVATGDEAAAIADVAGYTTAEVGTEVLNVRSAAGTDSDIIATIDNSNEIEVVEDQGDWVKVILDGEMYGYVSADYVYTTTEYATGETLEEEQARLEQEWLDYLAEQEAQQAAAEAAYLAAIAAQQSQQTVSTPVYTETTDSTYTAYTAPAVDTSGALTDQCDSAWQSYLAAQEAADAAVANGEGEQAIVDTAAAAQEAYATYLSYQNQVDMAAAGLVATAETAQTTAAATTADQSVSADTTQTAAPAAPASNTSMGQAIADYACQFVGNPYVYGGSSLTGGADCSGFTMSVMANFGIGLPHNAEAQSGCGSPVSLDSLQPGDLLFYEGGGGIGHVSMYIGGGQVVHASNPTNGILISDIGYRSPVCARRFV